MKEVSQQAILITDLHSLKREKARLKRLSGAIEEEGHVRLDHVKKHFGSMALNAIFPQAHPGTQIWRLIEQAIKSAWGSTNFRSVLISTLITFLEVFGIRQGVKFFEKYFKKGEKKKEESSDDDKNDS